MISMRNNEKALREEDGELLERVKNQVKIGDKEVVNRMKLENKFQQNKA